MKQTTSNLTPESKVIIYGAGKIGRRVYDLCVQRGIDVVAVWDNHPEKVVAFHKKELITRPPVFEGKSASDYQLEGAIVIVTVFAPNVSRKMASELENKGFGNVIYKRSEISAILINHCHWLEGEGEFNFDLHDCFICPARRDEHVECDVFNKVLGMETETSTQQVIFPTLGFLLTTKCNLTCVGCNHLRDHFEKTDNVDFNTNEILSDLNKLLDAVDFVKSLVIVGGEALMHPDFEYLLEQILALPKVGFVQLITNGTTPPRSEKVYELLANKRVVVEVSGYGNEPGGPRVKKRELFFSKLSEYDVFYRYDEATLWTDFGDFHERKFSQQTWENVYKNCCFVSHDLFNGQLHKCSRSAYGLFLDKIPDYGNDYVDVRNCEKEMLRDEISRYLNVLPQVCRHCNGTTTKTIPAGVQVIKKVV